MATSSSPLTIRPLFEEFIAHGPIHAALFSYCNFASLICVSKTCRLAMAMLHSWMNVAYNINHILAPYFGNSVTNVSRFREMQAETGTLISGSTALQFFDRTSFEDSDLDLYVQASSADRVGLWLMEHGYEYVPDLMQAPKFIDQYYSMIKASNAWRESLDDLGYRNREIAEVFDMKKGNLRIQVICARHSALHVILGFHSTCVMNFIAYNMAYALYPRSTFEERLSLLVQMEGVSEPQFMARDKYRRRGWRMVQGEAYELCSSKHLASAFGGMERNVGDRYTWTIPLDVGALRVPDFMKLKIHDGSWQPGSVVDANSWKLVLFPKPFDGQESRARREYEASDLPIPMASCSSSVYSSETLNFVYAISRGLPEGWVLSALRECRSGNFVDAEFNQYMVRLHRIRSWLARFTEDR